METESEFLQGYDARRYPMPIITVDSVLFTLRDNALNVLLVKRANHPQRGRWGLPGGFVDLVQDSSLADTAVRKLREKTNVEPPYLSQLQTFSGPARDPRGWSVTTTYFALVPFSACRINNNDVDDVRWVALDTLSDDPPLAFDHRQIIDVALGRLRSKTLYSMIPVYCLPACFTLAQLQGVIESILGRPVQRKSLMRRFEASDMFEETGDMQATPTRKARLFRQKPGVDLRNFSRNLQAE